MGLAEAYLLKNVSQKSRHSNPTTKEVFQAIDQAIQNHLFDNEENGYAVAKTLGFRLRFGMICDPVQRSGVPDQLLTVWWNEHGTYVLGSLVGVRPEAITPAVAALQIFNNYRSPPYFVLAVEDESHCLQRVYFHESTYALDSPFGIPVRMSEWPKCPS